MARLQETNPKAARVEAAQLREQGNALLARAEELDPTPLPKKTPKKKKASPKKKKTSKTKSQTTAKKGKK